MAGTVVDGCSKTLKAFGQDTIAWRVCEPMVYIEIDCLKVLI